MAAPQSVNLTDQQTIHSDIGDYADRNDIIQLLNVDLAPFTRDGAEYHRYRIEVSKHFTLWLIDFHEPTFEVPYVRGVRPDRYARLQLTKLIQTLQTGFHRVWAPRAVTEVRLLSLMTDWGSARHGDTLGVFASCVTTGRTTRALPSASCSTTQDEYFQKAQHVYIRLWKWRLMEGFWRITRNGEDLHEDNVNFRSFFHLFLLCREIDLMLSSRLDSG